MGEERGPRWGLLGALLAVLLLGIGAYQLVSRPSTPAAPEAAAAQDEPAAVLAGSGGSGFGDGRTTSTTSVRLGRHLVTLSGPGVAQAHRETSASALGRVGHGWLVKLTSKACEGRSDPQVSYGVARASGRFTAWKAVTTRGGPSWRSPGAALVLVEDDGARLILRRTSTGAAVARFRTVG
jgi:hypothetical protein